MTVTPSMQAGERRIARVSAWILQLLVAAILFQTLFFKFSGAEESRYIFTKVGAEPVGRYASAVAELLAVILLLVPRFAVYGAALSLVVISGAIGAHLTRLGIVVRGDGGLLFGLALVVFFGSPAILVLRRKQIPFIGERFGASTDAQSPARTAPHYDREVV